MKHIMIDVEALRLHQPWKAPLLQIGAVTFDEMGVVGKTLSVFSLPGTEPLWVEEDRETREWWESKDFWPQMQRLRETTGVTPLEMIDQLSKFIEVNGCEIMWFAGPTYDQVMLEAYYDNYGLERPWKFNNTRDYRTIRKQWAHITEPLRINEATHDALDDAMNQVRGLREISQLKKRWWQ